MTLIRRPQRPLPDLAETISPSGTALFGDPDPEIFIAVIASQETNAPSQEPKCSVLKAFQV
jgi:hypothetical protein